MDLDDGPARYLPWTAKGSLFVPMAMAERQPWRLSPSWSPVRRFGGYHRAPAR